MSDGVTNTNLQQDPAELAFLAFIRTYGHLASVMEPYFASFGITGAQWGVLRTLHRAELAGRSGLRLTDLGAKLLVRPPSVTGVVDRLERDGLVLRTRAEDDQRAKHVALTSEGRRLLKRVLRRHHDQVHLMLACLDENETAQLHAIMLKMEKHYERLKGGDPGPLRVSSRRTSSENGSAHA
jgi:DNA-binding MarR family transcriptional regulator